MLYNNVNVSRGEISLTLNKADCEDLASACVLASVEMRKPGIEYNPGLASRLDLLCTLFMVAFDAVKQPVEVNGGVNGA